MKRGTSLHISNGKSDIFWKIVFSRSLRHVTHLLITPHTAAFVLVIQIPLLLKWFRVSPLALSAALLWLHWIITSETVLFLGRMTGCCSAYVKLDFLNLPSTRMILSLSRNGSSWSTLLQLATIPFLTLGIWFLCKKIQFEPFLNIATWPFWIILHQWFDLAVATIKLYWSFSAICLLSPT